MSVGSISVVHLYDVYWRWIELDWIRLHCSEVAIDTKAIMGISGNVTCADW